MLLLIVWVVRKNMRPIHRLSQAVSQRTEQDLTPLPTQNIPSEVVGFVSAINLLLDKAGGLCSSKNGLSPMRPTNCAAR